MYSKDIMSETFQPSAFFLFSRDRIVKIDDEGKNRILYNSQQSGMSRFREILFLAWTWYVDIADIDERQYFYKRLSANTQYPITTPITSGYQLFLAEHNGNEEESKAEWEKLHVLVKHLYEEEALKRFDKVLNLLYDINVADNKQRQQPSPPSYCIVCRDARYNLIFAYPDVSLSDIEAMAAARCKDLDHRNFKAFGISATTLNIWRR